MFSRTGIDLVESGEMILEKGDAEEIVVTAGASWKCPTYVRKLPPCRNECPSSEDIRGYLTKIALAKDLKQDQDEAFDEAWYLLTDKNPLPSVHGRICPHPCETGCNRKEKADGAVAINNMERAIGDHGIARGLKLKMLTDEEKSAKVAIIGSGPSGLSCAYQLRRRGYQVTIFEAFEKAGGMLRYGIPVYRLPDDVLDKEIQNILDLGVELKLKTRIGEDVSMESLREEFDALYVAIGAHGGAKLNVPGEEKAANVFSAASYLNRVNAGAKVDVGDKVVVVGGGDSAIDAARASLRMGRAMMGEEDQVETESAQAALDSARASKRMSGSASTIVYRRTRDEMPAIESEIEEAHKEGINIEYLAAPKRVIVKDGRAIGIELVKMKLGDPDKSGRKSPVPIEGSEYIIDATSIIVAIGQKPQISGGLKKLVDEWGWVKVGKDMTSQIEGVFAGGDAHGLGISTRAVGDGRKAARSIDAYIKGINYPVSPKPRPVKASQLRLSYYPPMPRHEEKSISGDARGGNFEEITKTISKEDAIEEASRCMSCGLCFNCDQCRIFCPREAIERDKKREQGWVMFTDYTKCNGCHICAEACPCNYIEMGMGL